MGPELWQTPGPLLELRSRTVMHFPNTKAWACNKALSSAELETSVFCVRMLPAPLLMHGNVANMLFVLFLARYEFAAKAVIENRKHSQTSKGVTLRA